MMTVHNKVYENMACGKAFLTGESPAIKAQFENRREIIYCERTPEGIAEAILEMRDNPQLKRKARKERPGNALFAIIPSMPKGKGSRAIWRKRLKCSSRV